MGEFSFSSDKMMSVCKLSIKEIQGVIRKGKPINERTELAVKMLRTFAKLREVEAREVRLLLRHYRGVTK